MFQVVDSGPGSVPAPSPAQSVTPTPQIKQEPQTAITTIKQEPQTSVTTPSGSASMTSSSSSIPAPGTTRYPLKKGIKSFCASTFFYLLVISVIICCLSLKGGVCFDVKLRR